MNRERFLIIDGHGLIYRSIFRPGPPLTSKSGEPTRGTYTFVQSLFSVVDKLDPSYCAVAVDCSRKRTFRRKLYPAYKAKRDDAEGPPEEVVIQLQRCMQILEHLNLPLLRVDGFEADDIIATLADKYASDDVEAVVATRDKDMHQIVSDRCRLYDPATNDWVNDEHVIARWGVPPKKVPEVMALMGDPTDGIPGIRGIGKVKALALIKQHGSAKKAAKACGWSMDEVKLMLKLVRLRRDVPLPALSTKHLEFNGIKTTRAKPLFRELGFRSFL